MEGLATCCAQGAAVHEIVIDACLPVLHELAIVIIRKRCDEGVTFWPEARVDVGDEGFRASCGRAELYREFARSDKRGDLEHFDEAVARLVSGDIPDCVVRGCSSNEHAAWLSNSRVRDHRDWIPGVEPVGLAHRAQQGENYGRLGDEALRKAADHTVWLGDVHAVAELGKVANIFEGRGYSLQSIDGTPRLAGLLRTCV